MDLIFLLQKVGEVKRLYFDILELQQQECLTNPRISSILVGHPQPSVAIAYQQRASQLTTSIDHSSLPIPSSKKTRHRRQVTFDQETTSDESQLEELIEAKLLRKRRPLLQNDSSADDGETETLVSLLRSSRNGAVGSSTQPGGNSNGSNGNGNGSKNGSPHHSIDSSRRTSSTTSSNRNLKPEFSKALVAMGYVFIVTWITALVMVIVHDRVPDMEKYPPLPDLFLDNMPHIPWAFEMCEVTGTILLSLWLGVLFFHKHRMILLRRFFALSGTVFLLRCVTMLITSLSVPGTHLKCNPRPYGDWTTRLYNAYLIWKGAGMSIQGVRTCGDYMFSGHTVALTMLNFFVTECKGPTYYIDFATLLKYYCTFYTFFDVFCSFHRYNSSPVFRAHLQLAPQHVRDLLYFGSTRTLLHRRIYSILHHLTSLLVLPHISQQSGSHAERLQKDQTMVSSLFIF